MSTSKTSGITRDLDTLGTKEGGEKIVKFLRKRFAKLLKEHKNVAFDGDDLFSELILRVVEMVTFRGLKSSQFTGRDHIASYVYGVYNRVVATM